MSTIAFAIDRPVMEAPVPIPFPSDPDDAAMLRLAAGDDHALDEIIARWSARLISFLLRLTGNHATACDLAQEAFVRLYRSRDNYRSGGSFSGLLFQIASNLAKNHTRWKSRHPETPLDDDTFPEPAAKAYATPDREAEANETAEAVRDAVLALPEDLRTPLVLSVYEQKPQDEIAAILGCTRKAVETRIYRARQILRERLAQYFSEG